MSIPDKVLQLVEHFDRHHDDYKSGEYGEAEIRLQFIDPLFKALGWDIYNEEGIAEAYKDVIPEYALQIGGATETPDYCFRVGGSRRFFVEAKKPSINLKDGIPPAFQLRRYAWSAKLPFSILTDFEEFAVYDCRTKPARTDSATTSRINYITYSEYPERWDEVSSVFSREAVQSGSFDEYAKSTQRKKGTAEVDAAFLKEIESWRELLARNIALRNPVLTQQALNFSVQRIIDRIIFLRISEDRGIEPYGRLKEIQDGEDLNKRLLRLFHQADNRYNSGLFHLTSERGRSDESLDTITPNLTIDDATLKSILKNLYYPESPYEFSVLPADILGQVYEQFLGKVIRLTKAHRAKVEEKPEVKKAGGVYYTPTYIVDYIVEQTVGERLMDKKPGPRGSASKLKILDPACGSGSFLLGAYQYLLDWYRDAYVSENPERHARGRPPRLFKSRSGDWKLTIEEKRRILLSSIYGVDIDPQAVEVTKLSLLTKVLEEESAETIGKQLSMFHERALPDLGGNIKCGNSLIGPDYLGFHDFSGYEELRRVNPFDWRTEFPDVTAAEGGFDVIIGNPPYIRIQILKEWAPTEVEFFKRKYSAASIGNYDIYVVFVERALQLLNGRGRMGYILPHKFFLAKYGEPLRGLLAGGQHLTEIVHFGDQQVFEGATTYTCLLILDKAGGSDFRFVEAHNLDTWRSLRAAPEGHIAAQEVSSSDWSFVIGPKAELFNRLDQMPIKLEQVATRIAQGIRTSANKVYVLDQVSDDQPVIRAFSSQLGREVTLERESIQPFLRGCDIKRYEIKASGKVVIIPYELKTGNMALIPEKRFKAHFPNTYSYLRENKAHLESREHGRMKGKDWYGYVYPKNLGIMTSSKIVVPDIADRASFALDVKGKYAFVSGYGVLLEKRVTESRAYVLGLLNSKLLTFYCEAS